MYKKILTITGDSPSTDQLSERLRQYGNKVHVNDGTQNGYAALVEHFENIADSHILIVLSRELSQTAINQVLYAMLLDKPIVLGALAVKKRWSFDTEVISKRLDKILAGNFEILENDDLNSFLNNIMSSSPTVNYVLTNHEKILIRAQLRSFFRSSLS